MLIIPAIDIQDGCVVRLTRGKFNKKIYSRDPLKTARHWVKQGAKFLHIIDLDGAFSGAPQNLNIVREIARGIDVPIEFGGGVRTIEAIRQLLGWGIQRVILGTKAVQDPAFLKKAFLEFAERVIVSLDAQAGKVLIKGWSASHKGRDLLSSALALKGIGFEELIYTNTLKDGTLSGPDIKGIKNILKETGLNIIASGGISSLDDIRRLMRLESRGVVAVILGKALYEGRFTLPEALEVARKTKKGAG